jgi:hypothetical protein
MNTQKAAYWLALAVFGLAVLSSYQHGSFPSLHRIAGLASSETCHLASRAEQAFAMAKVLTGRDVFRAEDYLDRAELADLAQAQSEFLREQTQDKAELFREQILAQADMRRAELQMRRDQIQQIRDSACSQIHLTRSVNRRVFVGTPDACSHTRMRISTGDSQIAVAAPDDEEDSSQD